MKIAVDFDGTIVEHAYPKIGKERPFAISTLKRLQTEHHVLMLWSVREGKLLDEAVEFCKERGLEFFSVNGEIQGEDFGTQNNKTRIIETDMYRTNRNFGGLPDWGVIYDMITNNWTFYDYFEKLYAEQEDKPRGFWQRLFGKKD